MDRRTAEFVADAAVKAKRRVTCASGEYRIWRSPAGAEVWLHYPKRRVRRQPAPWSGERSDSQPDFDPIGDLMGMSVVHAGVSDMRMRLARAVKVSARNPLDGVCIASLASRRPTDKAIGFTFELLGFAAEPTTAGTAARVQVTGLAQRVWSYPSEAAYLGSTPADRLIGKGAMANIEADELADVALIYRPKPGTLWLITGEIRRSVRLINPVTLAPYYWVQLATDRGDVDLVANPDVIDGDISVGHVLQAVVAMTGRIVERLAN